MGLGVGVSGCLGSLARGGGALVFGSLLKMGWIVHGHEAAPRLPVPIPEVRNRATYASKAISF